MSTVKITCPQCLGFGLIGNVAPAAARCPQCSGRGTVSVDDSQSLATINTSQASTGTAVVVTAATAPANAATQVASKGNGQTGGHH